MHTQPEEHSEGEPTGISEEGACQEGDRDAPEEAMLAKTVHTKETLEDTGRHWQHKQYSVESWSKLRKGSIIITKPLKNTL